MSKDKIEVDYKPDEHKPFRFEFKPREYKGIITEYKPEYCQAIIEHIENGNSVESFPGDTHIDPDKLVEWVEEYPAFKAAVKIAFSAECLYWESLGKFARDNLGLYKDLLPTINRKLSQLENSLGKNGLRKSMYGYEEPDKLSKNSLEDADALAAMESL